MDYKLIDDIEIEGIDTRDYPDFCDAYISHATYKGYEMSDEQIDELNEDYDFVYNEVMNKLY